MKNTNLKLNKTKLVARLMIIAVLITGAIILSSCNTQNQYDEVDLEKRFNLDDGSISFLTMRSINVTGTGREVWNGSSLRTLYIVNGDETYSRPFISYSTTIENSDLGDGRTFFEKYIKKYVSFSGSPKYSMKIHVVSYAFQGEVGELRYEFISGFSENVKIAIYNNDELITTMAVTTTLDMPNEFYIEILDNSLFVISADKYSAVELGTNAPNQEHILLDPDLDHMNLSYLSFRDIRNSYEHIKINNYKSFFEGGYSSIDWQTGYQDVVNEFKFDFDDEFINANVKIEAEFYEYRERMGEIEYLFTVDKEKGNGIELYSNSILVGKVFYSSEAEISQEWLISFLNENLVVINVKK
ncbi:MAG: hypothetical protein IKA84_00815 [Clostridia bacterium]|nr:hypothetical protein [Clostridia bacterium]